MDQDTIDELLEQATKIRDEKDGGHDGIAVANAKVTELAGHCGEAHRGRPPEGGEKLKSL